MIVDIKDAYDYYIAHIDKSCNKTVISFDRFQTAFTAFIDTFCSQTLVFDPSTKEFVDMKDIPFLTNCNKGVMLGMKSIMEKIIKFKNENISSSR
jgi:hypothetical protein